MILCSATEREIEPTIDFIKAHAISNVSVLITGVGMTAATYELTKAVYSQRPDFLLQAGVAGCINRELPLTKIVVVENETIGDLGVVENENFRSVFDLKLNDVNQKPWQNGKLRNDLAALKSAGLTEVDAVTVNEISTDQERIDYYRTQLNASIESMEGAALHYVALKENIPFLQMRALSNFIGERDKNKWVLDVAIAQLNTELQRILIKFLEK